MKQKYEIKDNFKVRIVKNIPAQSGLGGGSADAACVIRMLNDMYQLNLSDLELIQVAKLIDEDTPYCLFNRPMIVEGIGDTLTPIDFDMKLYYLIVKPGFGVSTKSFLRRYKDFTQCAGYDACLSAIKKNDVEALMLATHNDFQATVMKRNVRMKRVSKELRKLNLNGVCMTGSGTGIYGLTTDFDTVVAAHAQLALQYPFVKYGRINVINE